MMYAYVIADLKKIYIYCLQQLGTTVVQSVHAIMFKEELLSYFPLVLGVTLNYLHTE